MKNRILLNSYGSIYAKLFLAFSLVGLFQMAFAESNVEVSSNGRELMASARIDIRVIVPEVCQVKIVPSVDSEKAALGSISILCNRMNPPQLGVLNFQEGLESKFNLSLTSTCDELVSVIDFYANLKWQKAYICPVVPGIQLEELHALVTFL